MSNVVKKRFVDACIEGLPVSKISADLGIKLSTTYDWYKKWKLGGNDWYLKEKPPKLNVHTKKKNVELRRFAIRDLSLRNPTWGCDRIADSLLDLTTSATVQAILIEYGIGTVEQRFDRLVQIQGDGFSISEAQSDFIYRYLWGEDEEERPKIEAGQYAGQCLFQAKCRVGARLVNADYYAEVIIDAYSKRIFCRLSKDPAVGPIEAIDEVTQKYRQNKTPTTEVRTSIGKHYGFTKASHPFGLFLKSNKIAHRLISEIGPKPRRPTLLVMAWKAIYEGFLIPNHVRYAAREIGLHDLDYDLAGWLAERELAKARAKK